MITLRRLTGGVLIGWASTFASIAVGLFMSPFLIHHLGETGYGVWVLIQSTVSYMYFMDLGLRTTVVRFTTRSQAQGDHDEVNRVVSAALWIRVWTAALILTIAVILSAALPHIFKVPAAYLLTARVALLLCASTLSCTLVFSVFSAVLSGMGRFDLLGMLELAQMSITSLGLVPILYTGHSLIAMALWQFTVVLLVNGLTATACFRVYPELRLAFGKPKPDLLRALWSLGFYVLLINGAGQLILYTDNVVVGAFVAAAAVSYYAVAGKMVEYLRQSAIAILKYFMPLATSFVARGQMDRVRQLHTRGTQAVLLITYPIAATLFVRGDTFLRLWIGSRFSSEATPVLQILTISAAVMLANSSTTGLAIALDEQRTLAWVTVGEGLANLALSILLVRRMGVLGVAIGTVIPTVLTSLFFWPQHICRRLGLSTPHFIFQAWLKPTAAVIPFVLACRWADGHWTPTHLITFVLEMVALAPVVVLGAAAVFWRDLPTAVQFLRQRSRPNAIPATT